MPLRRSSHVRPPSMSRPDVRTPTLGYAGTRRLRRSAGRDPEVLARNADHPDRLTIVLAGEVPVLRSGDPATGLLTPGDTNRVRNGLEEVFLGHLGERPVIARL